jgi:hypothetical protein
MGGRDVLVIIHGGTTGTDSRAAGIEGGDAGPGIFLFFVMKILRSADDRADKWKLSLKCYIFIALVRRLWLLRFFLNRHIRSCDCQDIMHPHCQQMKGDCF